MNGNVPAEYRLLFPLAPVLAVMILSVFDVPPPATESANASSNERVTPACANSAQSGMSCREKAPSRSSLVPTYRVKLSRINHDRLDYDAGRQLVVLHCTFDDLSAEHSIVGMSEIGLVEHLQTDAGTLVEGGSGLGVISPNLSEFKNAPFLLHASVPLETQSIGAVTGAVTVLRAEERASLAWREPFGSEIGHARKAGDFEITLTKCAIASEFMGAEWSCKMAADPRVGADPWASRQMRVGLICSDKTTIEPETSYQNATIIRRIYRIKKKFPVLLDMSFVSVLKKENLRFELPGMTLDGSPVKKSGSSAGQNF